MAKSERQKLKLLYLKKLLEERSDEAHPLGMQEILDALAAEGIQAERKSIYSDIACLQDFGMDILLRRGPDGGYFLASREFELPELKLLVDAVQASKFLTTQKSMSLISKLETLASRYEAGALKRQVVVSGRVKTMNESIYYNVDRIHEAIANNLQITFRYFDWDFGGERKYRPGLYTASPYALIWDDQNYYLVAHSERHGLTHYRVDKMNRITQTKLPRLQDAAAKRLDLSRYGKSVFSMFGGELVPVRMRFHNSLLGVVLDRFGRDAMLIPDGPEHFLYTAEIAVSPNYFGWLAEFGDRVKILSPDSVAEAFIALCKSASAQYND
jgi:predicted DNA-binding transcriptional regulator YafY